MNATKLESRRAIGEWSWKSRAAYRAFQYCFAIILFAAAGLKAGYLTSGNSSLSVVVATGSLAVVECGLALLLILDLLSAMSWFVTLVMTFGFVGASMANVALGHDSCECLGDVKMQPWHMLVFDIGIVFCFLFTGRRYFRWLAISLPQSVAMMLIALSTGALAAWSWPVDELGPGVNRSWYSLVLKPDAWVGEQLPVVSDIVTGDTLMHGAWRILIYSSQCPHCTEVVANGPPRWSREDLGRRIAMINVHPDATDEPASPARQFLLSGSDAWRVRVPVVLDLHDGIVQKVTYPGTDLATTHSRLAQR
jgi:hypothetical protein